MEKYIDHTLLKATATKAEIANLCNQAKQFNFYAVCVNSYWIPFVYENLKETNVKIASVIGFPLGAMDLESKVFEAKKAVEHGADEIDMVINQALVLDENYEDLFLEISEIKKSIGNKVLKVILETCNLTDTQIVKACEISVKANADFVKTSTGFATAGANKNVVQLMLNTIEGRAKVKASGGVRDIETAKEYIQMGVSRLGTSSGIAIIEGKKSNSNY